MHKELNPITRLKPEMFSDRFRDGRLAFDSDRGFHIPPLHIKECNTTLSARQASSDIARDLADASLDGCRQAGVLQRPTTPRCKPEKWRLHVQATRRGRQGITGFSFEVVKLAMGKAAAPHGATNSKFEVRDEKMAKMEGSWVRAPKGKLCEYSRSKFIKRVKNMWISIFQRVPVYGIYLT